MQDHIIATIERSERARIQVAQVTYKGKVGIDVRLHEIYRTTGEWGPTSRGTRVRLEELPDLIAALERARDEVAADRKDAA